MDVVDWSALSVLAAVMLGAVGYLSRQFSRELARAEQSLGGRIDRVEDRLNERIDRMDDHFGARFDRLEEQYIRHLEAHATH